MRGVKHNPTFKVFWILSYLQLLPSASDGQHGIFSSAANTFPVPSSQSRDRRPHSFLKSRDA